MDKILFSGVTLALLAGIVAMFGPFIRIEPDWHENIMLWLKISLAIMGVGVLCVFSVTVLKAKP